MNIYEAVRALLTLVERGVIHTNIANAQAIADLRAASANNGWRPIATAPKDGEHILVRTTDEVSHMVYAQSGGCLFFAEMGSVFSYSLDEVVGWQPLPPPPEAKP